MSTANTASNTAIVTELGNALVRWRALMNERAIKGGGLYKPSELWAHDEANPPGEEENRIEARVIEIGKGLLEQGGEDLMTDVFYEVEDQFSGQHMASLDHAWTGIGGWVA